MRTEILKSRITFSYSREYNDIKLITRWNFKEETLDMTRELKI